MRPVDLTRLDPCTAQHHLLQQAIGQLKPDGVEAHFIVAACENMVSEKAMRPGDILTASNGKTIEASLLYISRNVYYVRENFRICVETNR